MPRHRQPIAYIYASAVKTRRTYVIEPIREGSKKLRATVLLACDASVPERTIDFRSVPLDLRWAAAVAFRQQDAKPAKI